MTSNTRLPRIPLTRTSYTNTPTAHRNLAVQVHDHLLTIDRRVPAIHDPVLTKLVEDSLSENSHKMGSFLISKIERVRVTVNRRSVSAHDMLEFRGLVRG